MRTPIRVLALFLGVLALVYCGFTLMVTWSEAGFIDPFVVGCAVASLLIIAAVIYAPRHASK